jgi:cation diffusion facilitator CzcD-associated flavoprotein CzcO
MNTTPTASPEHADVVVVGAGLSGIGAACHLLTKCPRRSVVVLESRADIGGTWSLFTYPGVRSDSDMHTLGYEFKPWVGGKALADGPAIMTYLRETVAEHGLESRIRFGRRVTRAEWSSDRARWTLTTRDSNGGTSTLTCSFLSVCSGYYSYARGYTPELPGRERFGGTIVHPQHWPESLEYAGRRVVVIGSGATAVTLVPAMAGTAAHVTMLQRSPTWVVALPDVDVLALAFRAVLPASWAYALTRWKNTKIQEWLYTRSRTNPAWMRRFLLARARKALGPDHDVETHFTPRYDPWDQRLCVAPNGDLFEAIRSRRASVVTGEIETFTETGIQLRSGEHLDADIIVTATGLSLVTLGEIDFSVDGRPVDFSQTWTYKGFAYSDVPNLASTFGYVNASWTLRADLIAGYVCRLLNHMEATRTDVCVPQLREEDRTMQARPFIEGFSPGYIRRAEHLFPRQGDREPWINPQRYRRDRTLFRTGPVDDGAMRFMASSALQGQPR